MDASALETRLKELMGLKKDLEDQVEEQMELLHAQGVGMTDSLVTPDGFPRSDVDLYVVRNARQQIIRLRNDVNGTMAEISRLLEELHSQRRKEAGSKAGAEPVAGHSEAASQAREPKALAIITGVAPGSPADDAGLKREDVILSIASIVEAKDLAAFMKDKEGVPIDFRIRRGDRTFTSAVTPRTSVAGQWKGLLGIAMSLSKE